MREQEEINQLLKDVIREAEAVRIPLGKIKRNVRVNARAKRRFGCCRTVQNAFGVRQFELELSQKVLACEDKKSKRFWRMSSCTPAAAARIMGRNGKCMRLP